MGSCWSNLHISHLCPLVYTTPLHTNRDGIHLINQTVQGKMLIAACRANWAIISPWQIANFMVYLSLGIEIGTRNEKFACPSAFLAPLISDLHNWEGSENNRICIRQRSSSAVTTRGWHPTVWPIFIGKKYRAWNTRLALVALRGSAFNTILSWLF